MAYSIYSVLPSSRQFDYSCKCLLSREWAIGRSNLIVIESPPSSTSSAHASRKSNRIRVDVPLRKWEKFFPFALQLPLLSESREEKKRWKRFFPPFPSPSNLFPPLYNTHTHYMSLCAPFPSTKLSRGSFLRASDRKEEEDEEIGLLWAVVNVCAVCH